MAECRLRIYCGQGRGKTSAAIGNAVLAAERGDDVIMIQFLKSKSKDEHSIIKRLEPEIRLFRFERSELKYETLTEEQKQEERMNIRNGLNYAHKVLANGECKMLILDEALGLLEYGIVTADEMIQLLSAGTSKTEVILTGRLLNDQLAEMADQVYVLSEK